MAEPEKYTRKNSFLLTGISLINSSGGSVPLNDYLLDFTIREDLFSNMMTAEITLMDVNNLAGVFPIIGNEQVVAVFKTPKFSNREIKASFTCVKIRDKVLTSPAKAQGYHLTLMSASAIGGTNKKISGSYSGKISEIIKDVLDESLDAKVDTFISDTEGKFKLTFPFMSPYQAVAVAAKKAYYKRKDFIDTNFLFYETLDGLNFKSLYEIKNQEPVTEINYYPTNVEIGAVSEQSFNSGELLEVHKSFNRVSEMSVGTYRSAITKYDLTNKEIQASVVGFEDIDVESNRLNKHTLTPDEMIYNRKGFTVNHVVPHQAYAHDDIEDNSKAYETFAYRVMDFMRSNSNKITIRVAGNSDLSVGQTIYLDCPKPQVEQKDASDKSDPVISGKYIISAINHVLTKQDYYCNMELIKDSVIQPLINAS